MQEDQKTDGEAFLQCLECQKTFKFFGLLSPYKGSLHCFFSASLQRVLPSVNYTQN